MIACCYNAVSKMRAHCSKIANFLAYAIFDGAGFWGYKKNKKKKNLLAYAILHGNALSRSVLYQMLKKFNI